jgi:hypothetical protein
LATFGNIWQHLATFGNIWQLLATFGNIWQLLARHGNIWKVAEEKRPPLNDHWLKIWRIERIMDTLPLTMRGVLKKKHSLERFRFQYQSLIYDEVAHKVGRSPSLSLLMG